jgi:hypothetical protein
MSNQKKVVIVETPESVKNLEHDDVFSLGLVHEDEDDTLDEEIAAPETALEEEEFDEYKSVEDLADDELIWDGGPTAGMIKAWKQEYEDIYVTSITFDKHIVWRVLNRLEYKQIVKKMEQLIQAGTLSSAEANMWNEEAISELCILFPKYDKKSASGVMAGVPSLIAQEVLEASGFVALEVRQL